MKQAVLVVVSGRVQGVGFRYSLQRLANSLGICGYAKNMADGAVEILAVAEQIKIDEFLEQVKAHPGNSLVDNLEIRQVEPSNYHDFQVL